MNFSRRNLQVHQLCSIPMVVLALSTFCAYADGYPDVANILEPTTNYLDVFSAFNPPVDTSLTVDFRAPQIAEWTRSNKPGDTMALTGEALSSFTGKTEEGRDTRFVLYGEGWPETDGLIQRMDGQQCAITLSSDLPIDEMYLMWPRNDKGYGEPVTINQTEAWWVGFDQVSAGETFYVYGRNLVLGDNDSYLFWSNNTTAATGWMTNTVRNPFRNDYTVPTDWSNGNYTLWAHNGKGRKYGWANSLNLEVVSPVLWNGGTKDMVADFGANGSDGLDDQAAFDACKAYAGSNPYTTVTIPAGTYHLSGYFDMTSNTRFVGDGVGETYITATEIGRIRNTTAAALMLFRSNAELHNMNIELTDSVDVDNALYGSGSSDLYFENVVFSETNVVDTSTHLFMGFKNANNIYFQDCIFIMDDNIGLNNVNGLRIKNCTFKGIYDCNQMVTLSGDTGRADLSGCTIGGLDQSDASDGFGWAKGRWIVDKNSQDIYVADNETIDFLPRSPIPELRITVTRVDPYVDYSMKQRLWCTDIPEEYAGYNGWSQVLWVEGGITNLSDTTVMAIDVNADWVDVYRTSSTDYPVNGEVKSFGLTDYVDFNSGEQYLLEGAETYFYGSPSSVTATTLLFDPGADLLASIGLEVVSIVGGRGIGQTRSVESVVATNTTMALVTLSEPWRVVPNADCVVNIGILTTHLAVYNNIWNGRPDNDRETASAGVALWGSSGNADIVDNIFSDLQTGIPITPYGKKVDGESISMMGQSMFNLVRGNRFENCYTDITRVDNSINGPATDVEITFLGNVFRNNYSTNAISAFSKSSLSADLGGQQGGLSVWQDNTVVDAALIVEDSINSVNQVWAGNTLHSANSIGWSMASGNTVALRGNTWAGASASYAGSLPGGVLELPIRVINIGGSGTTRSQVPIWNSGTAPLSWSATESSSWLRLLKSSGSVSDENGQDTLSFELEPDAAPAAGSQAVITVTGGGRTKQITIYFYDLQYSDGDGTVLVDLSVFESGARVRATVEDLGTPEDPRSGEFRDLGELNITEELIVPGLANHAYRFVFEVYNDASALWVTNRSFTVNRQR